MTNETKAEVTTPTRQNTPVQAVIKTGVERSPGYIRFGETPAASAATYKPYVATSSGRNARPPKTSVRDGLLGITAARAVSKYTSPSVQDMSGR
jgi:hypothetical protein